MKKHLPTLLPALALLTLGGCATTSNLATTENDGMYYSASDRVTAAPVAQAGAAARAEAPTNSGDVANPDYNGSTANRSNAEYYDDDYYYASRQRRFASPYRGSSLGYYDFAYSDPFFYGSPVFAYSPYALYSPYGYFDPFYQPYYGYGGLNINIGFGYGRSFYRPYGVGYGYNPYGYYPGSPWGGYNGGYCGVGYVGNYYNGGFGNGYYGGTYDQPGRPRTGRRDWVGDGYGNARGGAVTTGRGRVQEGGFNAPASNGLSSAAERPSRSRRVQEMTTEGGRGTISSPQVSTSRGRSATGQADQGTATMGDSQRGSRRWRAQEMPGTTNSPQVLGSGNERLTDRTNRGMSTTMDTERGSRRWRALSNDGQPAATTTDRLVDGQYQRRSRADWNSAGSGSAVSPQSRRQRIFESAPAQPSYSEPSRSYESARPARTYSEPSRSYSQPSRSYSEPSRSSGGGGGVGGRRGRVE